jgi:hypothetical protein
MEKTMCGNHAHAVMTKRMTRSTDTIWVIDAIVAKRGETVDTKPSAMPTSLQQATLIDAMTGMMIGAAMDAMIVGTATVAGSVETKAIIGNGHRGFQNCRLLSS